MNDKLLIAIVTSALLILALPAAGQKTATDEVGFNAEKLYDVQDIDSVNLFNGNLTVRLPIGRRYQVGPTLSYQMMLIYNSRIYDIETYECEPDGILTICEDGFPARQSNAGLAWRVSLGRLLAPEDVTPNRSSFDRDDFIYEGPAGDEHTFPSADDDAEVILSDDPQPLRLVTVTDAEVPTREIEFPTGEIHRFQQLYATLDEYYGRWHLVSISDRFDNSVTITPVLGTGQDAGREKGWLITDTIGRSHRVNFVYQSQLDDTWNRGMSVSSMVLDAYEGTDTTFSFNYLTSGSMPTLQGVVLPDATSYTFAYGTASLLSSVTLPTGGKVDYTYQSYTFANEDVCSNGTTGTDNNLTKGIKSRTLSDGVSTRVWDYVQRRGPSVTVEYDNLPCVTWSGGQDDGHGPFYWLRTSVLAPVDTAGERVRSDHYFSIFFERHTPTLASILWPVSVTLPSATQACREDRTTTWPKDHWTSSPTTSPTIRLTCRAVTARVSAHWPRASTVAAIPRGTAPMVSSFARRT